MRPSRFLCALFVMFLCENLSWAADADQLFEALDRNSDGQLESNELDPKHSRLFERLLRTSDSDRDGKLSNIELRTGLQPQRPKKPLVVKQGNELPGADALLLLLARMDTNTNGQIEADEVPSQFRKVYERIEDRLGGEPDGILDRRELTRAAPGISRFALQIVKRMDLDVEVELALLSDKQWKSVQNMIGPRSRGDLLADPKRARQLFRQLDANGDGQVELSEVPDQVAQRFDQLIERADLDKNDKISEQELMAVSYRLHAMDAKRPSPDELQRRIDQLLKRLDRDGDNRISESEVPRRMAGRFDRLDRDGNGQLNREELAPLVESLSGMRRPEPRKRNKTIK